MLRPTIKRAASSLGRCFALGSNSHLKLDKSPAVTRLDFRLQLKCNFDLTGSWLTVNTGLVPCADF